MAELNENIGKIEKGSTLDKLYNRFLSGFQSAQDETLPDFTSSEYVIQGVDSEGNITYTADEDKINNYVNNYKDISMKNSAYLMASAIAGGGSGDSGSGGSDGDSGNNLYVAITGDTMTGKLLTPYGFSSGDNGVTFFKIYQTSDESVADRKNIVQIDGELHLPTKGLYINESNVLYYDNDNLVLTGADITLNGKVDVAESLSIGDLRIDKNGIHFSDGNVYYHSGNSNREDVDWTMRNSTVAGDLLVKGTSTLGSSVKALGGLSLGANNTEILNIGEDSTITLKGNFNILSGGIQYSGDYIVNPKSNTIVSFSAPNRILNLGDYGTQKIDLQSGIYDDDGEYELVGKFGDAYFPNSFKAGHHLGNILIQTYKNSDSDAGVVATHYLRFNTDAGCGFYGDSDTLYFDSPFKYNEGSGDSQQTITQYQKTSFGYHESESLFAPLNKKSSSLYVSTDADFYVFDKPVEGKTSIGISKSKTRLADNQLFFDDSVYWQGIEDGVKHYGNAYIVNDMGSVEFSSGFAGSGWKIYKNHLTGNISATFDELTIRKKMRVYELEVQKQSVTNGSLWVSDACSGDLVEEIV